MGDKPAAPAPSQNSSTHVILLILLAVGLFLVISGKLPKGRHLSIAPQETHTVDPSVKKLIGNLKPHDRLADQDRKELQDLLDKVGQ
jgi:hypothetical protein